MSVMTQEEYIAILFVDLGYDAAQRRGWLELRYGVRWADQLTTAQKSDAITKLKEEKGSE